MTIAYTYAPHHDERPATRRVSLNKLSVVLANLALWAALITSVALIAH